MHPAQFDIAVIGAGVIGTTAALYLSERGMTVALIDRRGIGEETSAGNAGAFAFADILPLASPGIMLNAPKWLFDPTGPLSVPPAYLPKVAPWLWRFFRASRPERFRRGIEAQAALMDLARRETTALLERNGLARMIVSRGALHLYDSERSFKGSRTGWEVRARHGIDHSHLDRRGIDGIQPGLSDRFDHATFVPEWTNVSDPKAYVQALGKQAAARGATFIANEIERLVFDETGVLLISTEGKETRASQVVLAGGAWSAALARQAGDTIPLETERGYNTTLPDRSFDLRCQLVFDDHGFVVSPLGNGIRVGGAVELAGLSRKPDFRRSRTMLEKAKRFIPGLSGENGAEWMGFRPSLPDSLPAIGRSIRQPRMIYAFGHGHLGLTQSAATARLVADIAHDAEPAISLSPYSPDRF